MGNDEDKKDETIIHKPDGMWFRGEVIGHVDKDGNVRGPDGILRKGKELGYVDEEGNVHKVDTFWHKGDIVGEVKNDHIAKAQDGFVFEGEEWGYVDEEGNIHQKDGFLFKGRIIGQMKGNNKAGALAYYILRFNRLMERYEDLENKVHNSEDKTVFLKEVRRMLEYVPNYDALGDFDLLMNKLQLLEKEILDVIDDRYYKKLELCKEAEEICNSDDWEETDKKMKELMQRWKEIGWIPKDKNEELWSRFQYAMNRFYERRREYLKRLKEEKEEEMERNRKAKTDLCIEAEAIQYSDDWKDTAETIKELREQWKEIGYAGKEWEEDLWYRFNKACNTFFERRRDYFDKLNREREENMREKEELCSEVESLEPSKESIERVKEIQARWKEIGPVPKEHNDELWNRFRDACDKFFEEVRKNRRERLEEVLNHKKEQIERLEESIEHDEENIAHWEEVIDNLRPGPKADEIESSMREKIANVEEKIESKREKIRELESDIRDIESKLDD
jgi:hypothetical protein